MKRGLTQRGITEVGITQRSITQAGLTLRGITQVGTWGDQVTKTKSVESSGDDNHVAAFENLVMARAFKLYAKVAHGITQ